MGVRTAFQQLSYFTSSLIVARALGFVQLVILARCLSRRELGEYAICFTLAVMLRAFSALGIAAATVRESARTSDRATDFILAGIPLRAVVSLVAMCVGFGIVALLPWRPELRRAGILFSIISVPLALTNLNEYLLAFQERAKIAATCLIVTTAVRVVLVSAAVLLGLRVFAVGVCILLTTTALWVATSYFILKEIRRPWPRPSLATCLRILAVGWPIGLVVILSVFYHRLDVVMVSGFSGNAEVALYSAAFSLLNILAVLQQPINKAALPFLTNEHARDPSSLAGAHHTAVKVFACIGFPLAVLGVLLSPVALDLIYGAKYWASILIAQVLIVSLPFRYMWYFTHTVFTASGKQNFNPIPMATGAVVNWGLNLVFIPRYGALGAAVAVVASFGAMLCVAAYLTEKCLHRMSWLDALWKPLAATAVMVGGVMLFQDYGEIVQTAVALVSGGGTLLLLRPFTRNEINLFRKALGLKRPAGSS